MTRKVHIAVMAYDGYVPIGMLAMLMGAMQEMGTRGWQVVFCFRAGDSILPRARNAELANFLNDANATDLVMIDSDTLCAPADLAKLVDHGEDVVGAPYRTRNEPLVWASVRWLHQDVKLAENGLLEVDAMGTGMIRISRNAAQKLWDAEKDREYTDPTCLPGKSRPVFWFDINKGHMWGEDITFCQKWRAMGGKVWTDPSISTSHIGLTPFNARLEDWLAQNPENMMIDDVIGVQTMVKNHFSKVSPQQFTGPPTLPDVVVAAEPPPAHLFLVKSEDAA